MKKPNFFILGAPKCGSTSLAVWLSEHPQVFFCPVKEPHYFNFDYAGRRFISFTKYEELFSGAKDWHIAVGEASVRYLYSRTAVPAILRYAENPRFIVMVRNPVDMAYSLHEQTVFNGDEDEENFQRAWNLQEFRAYGDRVPRSCADPQRLMYGELCKLGAQLKRLYDVVPRDQVLVLNLEDVKRMPQQEYARVLRFLELDDDHRNSFMAENTAKERRFGALWRILLWGNRALRASGVPHVRLGLTALVSKWARNERPRPPLSPVLRRRLREYFADDVSLLEELTGWKLDYWKRDDVAG